MVVNNPNNWHWVDKNCIGWARNYFNEHLVGLSTGSQDNDKEYCEITAVSSVEGDCEVNQRKGKVISLFDLQIVLMIKGFVDNDNEFEGSISIPEVAFDSSRDDYQFEISVYKETSKLNEIKPVIRANLLPQLRQMFQNFGQDLLITHGNDIQVPEEQVKSQFTKANQQESFAKVEKSPSAGAVATSSSPSVTGSAISSSADNKAKKFTSRSISNTSTIHLEPSFNVPAFELFNTFIDKERILIWSKSAIREHNDESNGSQYLMVGDKFDLFDGNISNELLESKLGEKLVMKWRLKDWNTNQWSTIKMEFHESNEFNETKLQITWSGIPVGEEDRVRSNFENYYVRPMKLIFGFGVVL
ncbi:hypothetical protein KAFR_0B06350 [Kazachstania africana CBS 2517]|uniref:Activator of Hsp90 ATPase AHSA1-like N-terminal domain-containing protein n=1 Tax=Kazachstania africana (strain ATCC 22294 / BCRC 22015 / CBS 2517 / CECT 1963 / NBRC 1671 / NRRL Y-8276) TaxID=1071382 RepID=H2ARD1_KAZAF|nr:hypothetical protein KAFR_0B06350 [Kazachstania africana CBS 2517]CCF56931.1 hypothetical protein KAFR_0B06350 [Kazachstania africana CBS 2517]